ncbi:SDR family NAD(P)-dependent oxidoreductase [Saccharothrix sp. 6-C]|uniref:Short-subunit dehydrogenase n=1 Tax=Saccharothrix texasensis TaxID=103734 RepID=A0A3N1HGH8_9PSEU|nr:MULTISPECIES: SDR family NAD(P)-dependent oxidoreductase [Saccharothrix]QQQ74356.1 SDR family NAD(P)-dependent oxidoreductase [Saccharothrix sp. 6-C]ROP41608.1 short-subunit dehydrogenase [Saccharothrix texasensis]
MSASERPFAVVTGASSGIGLELARVFVEHGFDLVVAAENDVVHDVARELAAGGARVDPVRADLATFEGNEDLVAVVEEVGRPVDALAVNAGIGIGGDFVDDSDLRSHLRVVDLNISSAVHLAKRLLPAMVERGAGRVLFTSSVAATAPGPFHSVYAASKAFLASFSQALREELRDSGVTVTALMPGPTDTDFFRRAGMTDTKVATGPKDDPADVARAGFKALMDGDDHVVAGSLLTKAQASAGRVLPDPVKARAMRGMTEPGSGHS